MHFSRVVTLLGLACAATVEGNSFRERLRKRSFPATPDPSVAEKRAAADYDTAEHMVKHHYRDGPTIVPQTNQTTQYAVDGTALPFVSFDIGESYAGLMPIGKSKTRKLYFWYFPSANPQAGDEITIWLNGGPGCSSLEGLFQENGPVVWQYGTWRPARNPWTWRKLTNVVWVEQPVGTGFSQGDPSVNQNEEDIAAEFLLFWKNFVDTFLLQYRKVYVTGESYAGYYVPYIADAMLNEENKKYYNVDGIMIYDPTTSLEDIEVQVPAVEFAQYYNNLFYLSPAQLAKVVAADESCGFKAYREKYFTFPPPGKFPAPPSATGKCDVYTPILNQAFRINPCFDIYQIATTCPVLFDPLGFPGSFEYISKGFGKLYFDRDPVKKVINAPLVPWAECSNGVLDNDDSEPSSFSVLPRVIDRASRTIVAHGNLDAILLSNGTLLAIQNMTFGGKQGFQKRPASPFYVPVPANDPPNDALAGSGVFGITHTERKLTWVETYLSGHMVPQYAPSASYRHMEFLLGRIDSLSSKEPFTTEPIKG